MTQNIYDNEGFFQGYSQLPRSVGGLQQAPEWPVLRAMLPDLDGAHVLDLGCGFGWFCRWAREAGAAAVTGSDVSENMLARAVADTTDPAIQYRRADLETIDLPPAGYDLVYSSLTLHYIANLARLLAEIRRTLRPGGRFVFSAEHPIYTAPSEPGFITAASGQRIWPLNHYLQEGPRSTDWLAKGVIKQHRTVGGYLTLLLQAGFTLTHITEWGPSETQIADHPAWADERERPAFLLVGTRVA